MPIDKSKYPTNWKEISNKRKKSFGYICLYCLRPRLRNNPITTHHIDHDPMHNEEHNLAPLHGSCHLLFHSRYDSCKLEKDFWEICQNNWAQQNFPFMKELLNYEESADFIRHKIAPQYRRKNCSKNFLAENFSQHSLLELPIS